MLKKLSEILRGRLFPGLYLRTDSGNFYEILPNNSLKLLGNSLKSPGRVDEIFVIYDEEFPETWEEIADKIAEKQMGNQPDKWVISPRKLPD